MITDEQFHRLPRYVKLEIQRLRADVADLKDKLSGEPTAISYPLDMREKVYVPSRSVDVAVGGFELDVLAQKEQVRLTWQGVAFLIPMASNSIVIAGEKSPYVR